jgi:hypothetical protein
MERGGTQAAMKTVVAQCGIKNGLDSLPGPQLCHTSLPIKMVISHSNTWTAEPLKVAIVQLFKVK